MVVLCWSNQLTLEFYLVSFFTHKKVEVITLAPVLSLVVVVVLVLASSLLSGGKNFVITGRDNKPLQWSCFKWKL